ncbi:MAG: hypothetical protein ACTHQ3_18595 [Motilibacteraceae bacterium]
MNGPNGPYGPSRSAGSTGRPGRSALQGGGPLSGEDRAGAVARTYARGSRRLQLTESQLRYIARQESAGRRQGRPTPAR